MEKKIDYVGHIKSLRSSIDTRNVLSLNETILSLCETKVILSDNTNEEAVKEIKPIHSLEI